MRIVVYGMLALLVIIQGYRDWETDRKSVV